MQKRGSIRFLGNIYAVEVGNFATSEVFGDFIPQVGGAMLNKIDNNTYLGATSSVLATGWSSDIWDNLGTTTPTLK